MKTSLGLRLWEAGVYFFTYTIYLLLFLFMVLKFGSSISQIYDKSNTVKGLSESDKSYLLVTYGENNPYYENVNNVLDFVNTYTPSNILVVLFLFVACLFYMVLVEIVKVRRLGRNHFLVHVTNALGSIGTAVTSLMFFISSLLFLSLLYVGFFLQMWSSNLLSFLIFMFFFYSFFTVIIFLAEKLLSQQLSHATNNNRSDSNQYIHLRK